MSVLTRAMAAGIPGRLAPYSYVIAATPVDVYLKTTAGFEGRFNGLSGDSLRRLEIAKGTDAPQRRAEYLNYTLEVWTEAINQFDTNVTDADFARIRHLPEDDPRRTGYLTANTAMDTWLACRERLHAAFLDWSLDLTGTVEIPEPAGPEPVVVAEGHRVPDCTGYCTQDDVCSASVAEVALGENGQLCVEIAAYPGEKPRVAVFAFNVSADEVHLRTTDPAEIRRKADELYRFAGQVDRAAYVLEQLQKRESK
ncbi:hypothetical protein ACWD4T_03480 [Streptomyces umbrinus]